MTNVALRPVIATSLSNQISSGRSAVHWLVVLKYTLAPSIGESNHTGQQEK